jgi:hypothetical protein
MASFTDYIAYYTTPSMLKEFQDGLVGGAFKRRHLDNEE